MCGVLLLLFACEPTGPVPADPEADTAAEPEPVPLAVHCDPGVSATDPLVETSFLSVTSAEPGNPFMEIVDVDLVDGAAWAVGQGGLVVGDLDGAGTLTERFRDPGMGRYHRVELLPEVGAVALSHRDQGVAIRPVADLSTTLPSLLAAGLEGLAAAGSRLYVSDRDRAGVVVVDVTEPSRTVEAGFGAGGSATWELAVGDGALYAADNVGGVLTYDLADPDAPVFVGQADALGGVLEVEVDGGFLYAAAGAGGVRIYSLADPLAPVLVATVETGGSAVSASVDTGLLWVAEHDAVSVHDVTDPRVPSPIGRDDTRQFALAVDAAGAAAVVGDWGYVEAWSVDSSVSAPALDVPRLALAGGTGVAEVVLTNRGNGSLELRGALADGAQVLAGVDVLPPGASTTLMVRFEGAPPASVCLATNDPDAATVTFSIDAPAVSPIGDPAPDFALPPLDGETVRLSDQLGHPVVLAYFATW